jgi:hypothetical protein
MERPGGRPSLHRLIGEAVARSARLQEESREAVADVRASTAALERTVAEVRRCRLARRTFGNGQFDAEDGGGPG